MFRRNTLFSSSDWKYIFSIGGKGFQRFIVEYCLHPWSKHTKSRPFEEARCVSLQGKCRGRKNLRFRRKCSLHILDCSRRDKYSWICEGTNSILIAGAEEISFQRFVGRLWPKILPTWWWRLNVSPKPRNYFPLILDFRTQEGNSENSIGLYTAVRTCNHVS
jgi:hypothetical protein